jgi:hypothetical protein
MKLERYQLRLLVTREVQAVFHVTHAVHLMPVLKTFYSHQEGQSIKEPEEIDCAHSAFIVSV